MRPPFSVETWVIIVKTRARLTETSGKRARVVFVQWCLAVGLSSSLLHVGLQTRAEPWLLLLIKADRYIKTCEGKKNHIFYVKMLSRKLLIWRENQLLKSATNFGIFQWRRNFLNVRPRSGAIERLRRSASYLHLLEQDKDFSGKWNIWAFIH